MVDPERDPGKHDDQDRRQISLENKVANVALQTEGQREPLIGSCGQLFHTIIGFVSDDGELRIQKQQINRSCFTRTQMYVRT